jgi:hypothetical protein
MLPRKGRTPSIVSNGDDQNVYIVLVLADWAALSRETDRERADLETTISDLMTGQFNSPASRAKTASNCDLKRP